MILILALISTPIAKEPIHLAKVYKDNKKAFEIDNFNQITTSTFGIK